MPVRKFRSVADMEQPHWREPGDPELFEAMAALWATGTATVPRRFPPGVHRHPTVESLNALTEEWARADFRAFHAARTAPAASDPVRPGPERATE